MQPIQLSVAFRQLSNAEAGLLVIGTEDGSPAEQAGILAGDILVRFDGKNLNSTQDILQSMNEDSIGKDLNVSLIRGGQIMDLRIIIGERESRRRSK